MKFKSDIEIQAGVEAGGSTGSNGQVLSSTGSGVAWIDQNTISANNAEHVVIYVKNTHTASIAKGTPVYITGTVGATDTVQIAPADASDSAKMPAVGLLDETLAVNAFGYVITGGFMDNITTDPIDGVTPNSNDTVYVKAGGGLTLTKPTGPTGLIQNVAKVGKVSGGNSGSLIVSSILRTNDVPNLTTGKIWVGDGNTTESTVVHLDETNGRMGIGTDSPSEKLGVISSDNIGTTKIISAYSLSQSQSTSLGYNSIMGSYSLNVATLTAQPITFSPNSSEAMRIDAYGNVGIGTTDPDSKLHIVNPDGGSYRFGYGGSSDVYFDSDTVYFRTDNGGANLMTSTVNGLGIGTTEPQTLLHLTHANPILLLEEIDQIADAKRWGIQSETSILKFRAFNDALTTAVDVMSMTRAGNVGIGTTDPGAKLHVVGTSNFQGNIQVSGGTFVDSTRRNIYLNSFDGGGGNGIFFRDGFTYNASITAEDHNGGSADGICISGYDGVSFSTGANSKNERMRITSSGNVGIGTTNPNEKLHAAGNIHAYDASGIDAALFASTAAGSTTIAIRSLGITHFNGGNVGIGTTSPAHKLEVAGVIPKIYINSSNNTGGSIIFDDNLSTGTEIQGTQGNVIFKQSGSEKMRITSDGKVGIGTTSPSAKLEVSSTSGWGLFTERGIKDGSTSTYSHSYGAGNAHILGRAMYFENVAVFSTSTADATTKEYRFKNSADKLIVESLVSGGITDSNILVLSGSNVGIGTTSPEAKLHVVGNVLADAGASSNYSKILGNAAEVLIGRTTTNGIKLYVGSSNQHQIQVLGNFPLDYYINGAFHTRFSNDGNVGIGTTSPSEKLNVNGNILATGTILGSNLSGTNTGDQDLSGYLLLSGGTVTGNLTLSYAYPRINLYDTNNDSDYSIINNDGSFSIYDVTNNSHILSIASGGNATFAGSINTTYVNSGGFTDGYIIWNAAQLNRYGAAIELQFTPTNASTTVKIGANGSNPTTFNAYTGEATFTGNVGIGTTSPGYKLDVSGGINAGGKVTYSKSAGSLSTTGYAVAGLTTGFNGASAGFTFTCFGHTGKYQRIVYSCHNAAGTWITNKVIDEGTNDFDVVASANGSTITFTFKSTSGTKSYTPRVTVEASGAAINSTYA